MNVATRHVKRRGEFDVPDPKRGKPDSASLLPRSGRALDLMRIVMRLDVMLARRKMRSRELAHAIGLSEQNVSLLKSGKVKGVRFETLARICEVLDCQPGDLMEAMAEESDAPVHAP